MTREAVEEKIFKAFCLTEGIEEESVEIFEVPAFDVEGHEVPFDGFGKLRNGHCFHFHGEFDGPKESLSPLKVEID